MLFLLVIYCNCLVFGLPIQDHKIDPTALSELAAALNIPSDADLVGQSIDPMSHPSAAAITLDSIARWIYQENLTANKKAE